MKKIKIELKADMRNKLQLSLTVFERLLEGRDVSREILVTAMQDLEDLKILCEKL